ncbi:MAG: hypothetical protein GY871_04245 [Actinomycetales bacterium]|nr:hypothetical protein [Actinomycetales bacterium]
MKVEAQPPARPDEELPPGSYRAWSLEALGRASRVVILDADSMDVFEKNEAHPDSREHEDFRPGFLRTVGSLSKGGKDWPVVVSVEFGLFDGHLIASVEATSSLVDWDAIESWTREKFPAARFQRVLRRFDFASVKRLGPPLPIPAKDIVASWNSEPEAEK